MIPVIEAARQAFPDAANDSQALTRALFHWHHGREENSKRGALARLEAEMAELKSAVERQGRILGVICNRLGIDLEVINGSS